MNEIEFWHWWVLAAAFGALDMLAQSGFFLWLGVAALVAGLVVFVFSDLSWQGQMLVFAGLAIVALVLARPLLRRLPGLSDRPTLNRRGDQYIGRLVVLESPIINGRGRAFIGDTVWSVEGGDQPAGATVRITGANGVTLLVEKS